MGRYLEYKVAKEKLKDIEKRPDKYLLINYSCTSLNEQEFARITCITVQSFENRDRIEFSISKYLKDNEPDPVAYAERVLLQKFYEYIQSAKDCKEFIHWNMNSERYGFEAIENRYRHILNSEPKIHLQDLRKLDLDDLLEKIYGENYVNHPKRDDLIKLNGFKSKDYPLEKDEMKLLEDGKWFEIAQLNKGKVDFIYLTLKKTINGNLKTKKKFINRKNITSDTIKYFFNELILGRTIFWLGMTMIGALISGLINHLLYR